MQILTPTGNKPIEEIQVGDDVLAFDVFTGEQIVNQVEGKTLWNFSPESPFFDGKFYIINGTWKCYGEQSIWRNDNQVVHIKNLVVGDIIFNGSDEDVVITSIEETTDTEWYKFEISGDHSYIVDNLTLHNASRFWVLGTGTWSSLNLVNWSGTSGGAGGSSVPGSADTATFDASSGGGTVTPDYNMTVTSITMGAFTGTLAFNTNNVSPTMSTFDCTGTSTRTLSMGSGTWTITGNNTNIWQFNVLTNATINPNTSTVNFTYSGGVGTRSIISGGETRNNFLISAGSDTVSFTGGGTYNGNLDFTGFTGTGGYGGAIVAFKGNLTLGTGMTFQAGAGTYTFSGTSPQTITTNGVTIDHPVFIDGASTNVSLGSALTMGSTRTLTLTQGTFNANNFNVTTGIFSSSNSNTRTLTMGSGTWTLTGNATTIWTTATTTNLTLNAGTSTVVCNYSGSTGTRTLNSGTLTGFQVDFNVSAGADIVQITNSTFVGALDFTGSFTGQLLCSTNFNMDNSLTLKSGMTASTNTITFSSNATITTAGISLNTVAITATGATVQLGDDLTATTSITLNNGTFTTNDFNINTPAFNSSNANVRTLNYGSSTITLTGTGTVYTHSTATNLTLNAGTSTINITDTSATSKTFAGGSKTYYNLTATGDNIIVSGSNTFNTLRLANAGLTTGLSLTSGTTQIVSSMTNNGSAGNLTKLISTSAGTAATISKTSGNVSLDYMSIKDSTATGGAVFYAGANSTNVSGNTGWFFVAAPSGGTTIGNNMANFITNAIMI